MSQQTIVPCLWFIDGNAEEAMDFYTAIFKDSKVVDATYWPEGGRGPKGGLLVGTFQLAGQQFVAINGEKNDRERKFNEATSFHVLCDTQQEVDEYWAKLTAGGQAGPCGWLKDRFGISWCIVPRVLTRMLLDKDAAKAKAAMGAMMQMGKLNIARLHEAYDKAG